MKDENDFPPLNSVHFSIPTETGCEFHLFTDLLYLEGAGTQTFLYFKDGSGSKRIVSKTLDKWMTLLKPHGFIRIHRSYIINPLHIKSFKREYGGQVVINNDKHLDISDAYRKPVITGIRKMQPA